MNHSRDLRLETRSLRHLSRVIIPRRVASDHRGYYCHGNLNHIPPDLNLSYFAATRLKTSSRLESHCTHRTSSRHMALTAFNQLHRTMIHKSRRGAARWYYQSHSNLTFRLFGILSSLLDEFLIHIFSGNPLGADWTYHNHSHIVLVAVYKGWKNAQRIRVMEVDLSQTPFTGQKCEIQHRGQLARLHKYQKYVLEI
jgi:hypothetical protein